MTPERPYAVVLGGSKVSDKLAVIEALLPKVDALLVGGGMCFTFLAAQGYGGRQVAPGGPNRSRAVGSCWQTGKIVLPTDVVVADAFASGRGAADGAADAIPDGWLGLDIGPESAAAFADVIARAKTVFWNGPMGVFEIAPFAEGTRGVAEAIIDPGSRLLRGRWRRLGGGRAFAGARRGRFSHISTGGGASLEFLEGKDLPGAGGTGGRDPHAEPDASP